MRREKSRNNLEQNQYHLVLKKLNKQIDRHSGYEEVAALNKEVASPESHSESYNILLEKMHEYISEKPLNISSFKNIIKKINSDLKFGKNVRGISEWLTLKGFLIEVTVVEGRTMKVATDQALAIGVTIEHYKSATNEYYVNLYNSSAQIHIIREYFKDIETTDGLK